jgi:hypothetical protein
MSTKPLKTAGIFLAMALAAAAQVRTIPADTDITVRTNEKIDVAQADSGKTYDAVVNQDVIGENGRVVIPRGSTATLVVRDLSNNEKALDLESVTADGNRYMISAEGQQYNDQKAGVGKNKRTAKYVGGGALLGTIVGAIAGGGKGAAIGAIAGGAAGAGAQTITRGKEIHVPAESLLTFHLNQPVTLNANARRNLRGESDRTGNANRTRHHYQY